MGSENSNVYYVSFLLHNLKKNTLQFLNGSFIVYECKSILETLGKL
jgi:hypothetical protein